MLRTSLFLLLLALCTQSAVSQKIPQKGVPHLENFTPLQYNNQGKVWSIDSAPNGLVYMASDGGLLEYDGKNWNNFNGSEGFTRAVHVENDSTIYTGSDLDFGVWTRNENLEFEYSSLYPFRDELLELNEEFWDVYQSGDNIHFISDYNIYIYRNENLTKIAAPSRFSESLAVGDSLYLLDEEEGLFLFRDLSLESIDDYPNDSDLDISGIYPHEEGLVLVTFNEGLYLFSSGEISPIDSPLSRALQRANVFSFDRIDEDFLAIGTVQKGLYVSDIEGNIIHYISRNKGLANNTILSLHYSPNGQLWMGLDYGVASLDVKSNLTFFYDFRGDFGTGYSALLRNDDFYLGTNKGLYRADWQSLNNDGEFYSFDLLPESDGQVWSLDLIDDQLFVSHDRGLFTLQNDRLTEVSGNQGFWTVVPYENYLLGGTYNGISIFEKVDDEWTFRNQMELIRGSANQVLIEKENILWVNIPNFGVIRAILDESLNPDNRQIYPSDLFEGKDPVIAKTDDGVQVMTDQFEYEYSAEDDTFIRQKEIVTPSWPEDLMPWISRPAKLNDRIDFVPLYNGFAFRYQNGSLFDINRNTGILFRKVEAYNNDEKIQAHRDQTISHHFNNVRIEFLVPNRKDVLYQYRLNNEETWSSWSDVGEVDLINLAYGNYELYVRALIDERIYNESTLSFRIAPPWFMTWYAWLVYLLLFAGLLFLLYYLQRITLKKQQKQYLLNQQQMLRQQAEKHRRKILKLERERLQEDYEQLKKKLREKTIELAQKAKENEDKNRLIEKLKAKIENYQQNSEVSSSRLNELNNLLNSYSTEDDNTFEIQMDQLHQEFYQRLKNQYPQLSSNDLRLCAYLKLGFNSKEIAEFMNIQPSSVYINRSRLRKKLELDADQDLHDFLNSV